MLKVFRQNSSVGGPPCSQLLGTSFKQTWLKVLLSWYFKVKKHKIVVIFNQIWWINIWKCKQQHFHDKKAKWPASRPASLIENWEAHIVAEPRSIKKNEGTCSTLLKISIHDDEKCRFLSTFRKNFSMLLWKICLQRSQNNNISLLWIIRTECQDRWE